MKDIQHRLEKSIGKGRVLADDLTLVACASDAGCYRKIPKLVVRPHNEQEVVSALAILHEQGIPVTFRAAGTSLSGQAVTDSVLLEARGDRWSGYRVLENGRYISAQPGITGSRINQVLAPLGRKFGPDPASVNSAMVGGIIANNAAGMSCGIHANSYATIRSARIILADGTLLDTSDPQSRKDFPEARPELVAAMSTLRERITSRPDLVKRIREKYRIKNTTGYGMNSFLDFGDPVDILLHLMVGSEGTLGFVSEATFETVPAGSFRASSLVYFRNLEAAVAAVPRLREAKATAIEIMDRQALRSVEEAPGIPDYIRAFSPEVTALLIDLEAAGREELEQLIERVRDALKGSGLERDFEVTTGSREIAAYWNVRKGVFPAVGGMRRPGTSVIIEDVAVGMEHLAGAVKDLRQMLDGMGYADAVIYGHVLDGNLHFIFSQDFQDPGALKSYDMLLRKTAEIIVGKYDGSLKAEHGTGLNMAPFVSYEWGGEIHGFMQEIKQAFDPRGILNPGVLITDDPQSHLKDLKTLAPVHESVDRCIECGFCEINCLSSGYTLSARQRIVVSREVEMLRDDPAMQERYRNLVRSFRYAGDSTCAGDGLCAVTCPLSIDTGELIKHMRSERNALKPLNRLVASRIAAHFGTTGRLVRGGLSALDLLRMLTGGNLPESLRHMPLPVRPGRLKGPAPAARELKVVYFPSCINQSMGPSAGERHLRPLREVTVEVLEAAEYQVIFPEAMDRLCCGTPWESKGFKQLADEKSARLEEALLKASNGGEIPVLCDTSPCICRMRRVMNGKLRLYEPVEFIHDHLLERLEIVPVDEKMVFHVTCTSTKMGLEEKFRRVAMACVKDPLFPEQVGCCGFAGDKGFTRPGLNRWALRNLKEQAAGHAAGFSNSRTCEIGLSRNSGIEYRSIFYLLQETMKKTV